MVKKVGVVNHSSLVTFQSQTATPAASVPRLNRSAVRRKSFCVRSCRDQLLYKIQHMMTIRLEAANHMPPATTAYCRQGAKIRSFAVPTMITNSEYAINERYTKSRSIPSTGLRSKKLLLGALGRCSRKRGVLAKFLPMAASLMGLRVRRLPFR